MTMKFIAHVALMLGVLLVMVSLDAVPDPPAVQPHLVHVNPPASAELDASSSPAPVDNRPVFPESSLSRFRSAEAVPLHRSGDVIALAGYAADPSPPLL